MANAARILGPRSTRAQRERLARRTIDNFYDFVCDVGMSLGQTRRQMVNRIESVEGHDRYMAARCAADSAQGGRGAVVVTAHMGSFEVGTAALRQREPHIHVLFHRDARDAFERIRSRLRGKLGVHEAPLDEGWPIWMRLRDALRNNEVVLIQGDRVLPGQKGMPVRFFNGHVKLPTGPARLALASGAPLVPIFSVRMPSGRIRLFIEAPIRVGDGALSVEQAVEKFAALLEKYVAKFPDQWLETRPAWIEDAGKPMPMPAAKRILQSLRAVVTEQRDTA